MDERGSESVADPPIRPLGRLRAIKNRRSRGAVPRWDAVIAAMGVAVPGLRGFDV